MVRHVRTVMLLLLIASTSVYAQKIHPRLQRVLNAISPNQETVAWVYFQDKGPHEALRNSVPASVVSERSLQRRHKVRSADALVDYSDLPVAQSYMDELATRVIRIRQRSKWFNGASVVATKQQLEQIENLPFVRSVELVARFKKSPDEEEFPSTEDPAVSGQPAEVFSFNYGSSLNQVNQIKVPAVHDLGNYGQNVIVGVFDNGFRLPTHEAFDTLETRTIATYDFVDHKVSVVPNNPSTSFGAHGVNTLSTIGGFKSGQLIGPAFGATYILARTENDSSETPFEEDNWVAAIEWADSIGVDVTSTSLGYLDYDTSFVSWTWEDMDGNTTAITRAADMAVERGIVVVNSAGNSGNNLSHNTLGAPADGDSVLSIGAVTSAGVRSSFSSVGPSTSTPPRIKPDVMAQGSTVRVASSTNPTGYGNTQGTSFSCPLAAGVAALIIHARPTDSPIEIMNAIRSTASQASSPDNLMGWGIINAMAALSPSSVSLLSPANSATDVPAPTQLLWGSSKWATVYQVQISTSPGFSSIVFNDSTLTDTSAVASALPGGFTYYWRARAKNLYGWSSYSGTRTFTRILLPPPAPALLSPADSATGQSVSLTLSWNSSFDATSYRVQVSIDSLWAATIVDDSLVAGTSRPVSGLSHNTEYFWRVSAKNIAGESPYSASRKFTTVIAPPAAPVLISLADDSSGVATSVTLAWHQAATASSYRIRLSLDSTFAIVFLDDSTLTDTTESVSSLAHGAKYYWQVGAKNIGGNGPWSTLWSFTTDAAVARSYSHSEGWNLVSLPLTVVDGNTSTVFPDAISEAFGFNSASGYVSEKMLLSGSGYWLKFSTADSTTISGDVNLNDTLQVFAGWNLIGSISSEIDTAEIIEIPSGIRGSEFYQFDNGYSIAPSLQPARGYWVKMNQGGLLVIQTPSAALKVKSHKR